MGPIDGLLTGGEAVPSTGAGEPDRAACALVALVCPAVEAGLGESVDDAVGASVPVADMTILTMFLRFLRGVRSPTAR